MSPRFGFIDIADRFCTGSSIMPQKKTPTCRTGTRQNRSCDGHLVALLTLIERPAAGLQQDNQEDKEPLFDTVDTSRRRCVSTPT